MLIREEVRKYYQIIKWKHICTENGTNFKEKIPEWFKIIEKEATIEGCKDIKQEYLNKNLQRDNINFRAFNENERTSIITWNENDVTVFGEDKKKELVTI